MMAARSRTTIIAACVLLAAALPAPAQIAVGSEFRVDTQGGVTPNFMLTNSSRASAMGANGDFVIAWTTISGSNFDVVVRRFDAAGVARGTEFLVNTYTTGSQYNHSIGIDDAGHFVVVWTNAYQDGSYEGIFGQRFDASGARRGAEFRVNSTTSSRQIQPAVAVAPGGEFVVVWASFSDGDSTGIFGQRYDASGVPAGAEFQVNTYTTAQQYIPSVDVDAAGNFVVVWSTFQFGGGSPSRGQRFSAAGNHQGGEFAISSATTFDFEFRSRVARSRDGSFVVAWLNFFEVLARRFDTDGTPLGADFRVNEYTTGGRYQAEVDADANGGFVITWTSQGQDGSADGVFGRRFDSTGAGGAEFIVNTYTTGTQWYPTVATDPAGNFIVAWHSTHNGFNSGVFAQRFGDDLIFEDGFDSGDLGP